MRIIWKTVLIINLIEFISNLNASERGISSRRLRSSQSQNIQFPTDLVEENIQMEDSFESILIHSSHIKSVSEFFDSFGVEITGRLKSNSFAEQALCEPEIRSVELDIPDRSSIYFPKCVRIARCGGCCGASHLLECIPTKISQKSLRRAKIKIKRSSNGRAIPEASHHIIKLDVHEECKCQCKVRANHCNSSIHRYRPELCKCECLNTKDKIECQNLGKNKVWDSRECLCKCSQTKLCSTGLTFSHETCSCIEDEYIFL